MLWSKAIGAGGAGGGGGVSEFSFVVSDGTTQTPNAIVPSTSQAGDLCFISSIGVSAGAPITPTGWTQIYRIDGGLFSSRGVYKVLAPEDIGTNVTVSSDQSTLYNASISLVFRGIPQLSSVYISSLTSQGEVNLTTSAALDTSVYSAPNILIATKSDFNKSYSSYSSAISGSFWTGGVVKNSPLMGLACCYEIQNLSNIDRTAAPANPSNSAYQHMHSFVTNAA